jgi:hypothetical protein
MPFRFWTKIFYLHPNYSNYNDRVDFGNSLKKRPRYNHDVEHKVLINSEVSKRISWAAIEYGDFVLLLQRDVRKGLSNKLFSMWRGLYTVVEVTGVNCVLHSDSESWIICSLYYILYFVCSSHHHMNKNIMKNKYKFKFGYGFIVCMHCACHHNALLEKKSPCNYAKKT